MAQEEIYNTRDRSYSAWHRSRSTGRYVGIENAQLLAMIDLDASLYVEYDSKTMEPVALIETAIDIGQPYKNAVVTARLAERAELPCYVVLYRLSRQRNPADVRFQDIDRFRVKRMRPRPESKDWRILSPDEWADALLKIRRYGARYVDNLLFGQSNIGQAIRDAA